MGRIRKAKTVKRTRKKSVADGPARNGKALEEDLYHPLRDYLVTQGYTVRGEVRHCDVVAMKDGAMLVIEMKRNFTVDLLIQAARRQPYADGVYVAIPRPAEGLHTKHWRGVRHLLRRLEIGLILVALEMRPPLVEVLFHPGPYQRRQDKKKKRAVLREAAGRSGDYNPGGSTRRKLVTAYRERAIHIACCLAERGPLSPKALRALGTGPKTGSILSSNYYDWFERIGRGVYALKQTGREALASYPDLAGRFIRELPPVATD